MIRWTQPCDFASARKILGLESQKLQQPWVPSFHADTNQIFSVGEATAVEQHVRHKIYNYYGSFPLKHRNVQTYDYWRMGYIKGLQLCEDRIPTPLDIQRPFEYERDGREISELAGACPTQQYYKDFMDSLAYQMKATDAIIKKQGRYKTVQRYSLDNDYSEHETSPHFSPRLHLCVCF